MDVLTPETCWALNKVIIKQVASSWSLFIHKSKYFVQRRDQLLDNQSSRHHVTPQHNHSLKNFMVLSVAWQWLFKPKHVALTYAFIIYSLLTGIYINKVNIWKQCLLRGSKWIFKSNWSVVTTTLTCCILRGPSGERILDVVPRSDGARNSG